MSLLINFYANFLQKEPKSSKIANVLLQSAKTSVKIGNCMLIQVQFSSAAITISLIFARPVSQKYVLRSQVQAMSDYDNGDEQVCQYQAIRPYYTEVTEFWILISL
ncbi:hypothetical protein TTHERM_000225977 (macronuclear) [Tetrahymena thermophila SB210]|uniref:Uncharacterized protein n=1 Tax=Tetrahymena thermophila (strain SB210) TaxID=312017 RepID=W7XK93_TETTS|nr:hypothetical protein TTHERM_000225977 [Tetrahymena thermophila SB210]EWS74729.1 hypothetical protein TTHERM_000225977 [Tetrahymena thermophila SB210]|eukprot:XP_012652730.1 hypothetical protein TTHERM_000225977 [Tetrahymena thermophila SB210]